MNKKIYSSILLKLLFVLSVLIYWYIFSFLSACISGGGHGLFIFHYISEFPSGWGCLFFLSIGVVLTFINYNVLARFLILILLFVQYIALGNGLIYLENSDAWIKCWNVMPGFLIAVILLFVGFHFFVWVYIMMVLRRCRFSLVGKK